MSLAQAATQVVMYLTYVTYRSYLLACSCRRALPKGVSAPSTRPPLPCPTGAFAHSSGKMRAKEVAPLSPAPPTDSGDQDYGLQHPPSTFDLCSRYKDARINEGRRVWDQKWILVRCRNRRSHVNGGFAEDESGSGSFVQVPEWTRWA